MIWNERGRGSQIFLCKGGAQARSYRQIGTRTRYIHPLFGSLWAQLYHICDLTLSEGKRKPSHASMYQLETYENRNDVEPVRGPEPSARLLLLLTSCPYI